MTIFQVERKSETLLRFGLSKSTFHNRIKDGLLPPPISLGQRAVGFLQHETSEMIAAMMCGLSESEMKAFVKKLVNKRKELKGAI
ncbi:MAG: AlpA family phage regulatory protein [Oceanospirillaceae bacterium]